MKSSGNGSAGSAGTHQQPEILEQLLRRLTLQQPSAALLPQRKWMHLRINHTIKERRLAWYDPCDSTALDAMLRSACGLLATQQYRVADSTANISSITHAEPRSRSPHRIALALHMLQVLAARQHHVSRGGLVFVAL